MGAGLLAAGLMVQPQLIIGSVQALGGFVAGTVFSDVDLPAETEQAPVTDQPTTREAREARQDRRERRERRQARQAARTQANG